MKSLTKPMLIFFFLSFLVMSSISGKSNGKNPPAVTEEEQILIDTFHEKLSVLFTEWEGYAGNVRIYRENHPKLTAHRHHFYITAYGITSASQTGEIVKQVLTLAENTPRWFEVKLKFFEEEVWIQTSERTRSRGNETLLWSIHLSRSE
jgi:hypothetical protein